ncbi:Zinc-binding dehydrogenase [Ceratobasidium sp. AG-Ba]|nr:Zinc-binding dehydrogenase [Ceratobasidium sp. AG-Ba]
MLPTRNASAIFSQVPHGSLITEETVVTRYDTIDLDAAELHGGILVKILYLSIEPCLCAMMTYVLEGSDLPIYKLGEPILGFAIATVLRSERGGINTGDNLYVTVCPFQQYAVLSANHPIRIIPNDPEIPLSLYLGFLGMPGMTAFYGLELFGKPQKGETIFISSGAGPVGSLVAQISKIKGLKVIASAGSSAKVDYLRSIGVDVAFNYKTDNTRQILAKEGPIDLYWDNVGGPTLETDLEFTNVLGRVVLCGAIGSYDAKGEPYGVKTIPYIIMKRVTVHGFIVNESEREYEGQVGNPVKFLAAITPLVKSGQLKWSEQVIDGMEYVAKAIGDVLHGRNTGKVVIRPS